jgi:hypothetical protein
MTDRNMVRGWYKMAIGIFMIGTLACEPTGRQDQPGIFDPGQPASTNIPDTTGQAKEKENPVVPEDTSFDPARRARERL